MSENLTRGKMALTAVIAAGTALWGWFGWMVIIWAACMVLDYVSGTLASVKAKDWNSQRAREGLWHKGGMILVVLVAAIADVFLGILLHMDGLRLPFNYTVLLCPVALAWYTLTELGSILENAALLGSRVPAWLPKWMTVTADALERTGERLTDAHAAGGTGADAGTWKGSETHFPLRQPEEETEDGHGESES